MKKFAVTFLSLLFTLALNAQNNNLKPDTHSLGLHAGATTGLGLSYRYWPTRFGFQVTGIPIFRQEGGHFVSLGLTGLYEIRKGDLVDFYGYFGNHITSSKSTYEEFDYSGPNAVSLGIKSETVNQYNIGVGIGFRCHIAKVVDFELQGGYGIFDITDNIYTFPTVEIGIYYRL